MVERRNNRRRNFAYYVRVTEDGSQRLIGHLADISPRGFKLDCSQMLTVGQDYRLRMELTGDMAEKPHLAFTARAKWCRPDAVDPFVYNVGFEINTISLVDGQIFQRIVERYGSPENNW